MTIETDQSTERQWAEGIGPHTIVREICDKPCECPAETEVCDE